MTPFRKRIIFHVKKNNFEYLRWIQVRFEENNIYKRQKHFQNIFIHGDDKFLKKPNKLWKSFETVGIIS